MQPTERANEIAVVTAPRVPERLETIEVHLRVALVVRLGAGSIDFFLGKLDELVDARRVALFQKIIGEHADERRRHGHGSPRAHAVGQKALEKLNERQVRAGDGLVEPLLFHHRRIFGVPHVRKVRVEHEREVSDGHG